MIELNASTWRSLPDFYDSLLSGLEAPDWHGRSINALIDSMIGGSINGLDPPYRIKIFGIEQADPRVRDELFETMNSLGEHGARCSILDGAAIIEVAAPDQPFPGS